MRFPTTSTATTNAMEDIDLGLRLERTHVVITGGCGSIGSATVKAFLAAGAYVTVFDLLPREKCTLYHLHLKYHLVDISDEVQLAHAFEAARRDFGVVQCCVALASLDLSNLPHHESIMDMPVEQWRETHRINVEGTFLTAKTWLRQIKHTRLDTTNVGLVIVGSESGHFGERTNAAYASGKSAVQAGLVQSLKSDVVRVFPTARYASPLTPLEPRPEIGRGQRLMLEGDVQGQRRGTRTSEHGAIPIGVQAEPGPVLVGCSSYVRQASLRSCIIGIGLH